MDAANQGANIDGSLGTLTTPNNTQPTVVCCQHAGRRTWVFRNQAPEIVLYEESPGVFIVPAYRLDQLQLAALGNSIAQAMTAILKRLACN